MDEANFFFSPVGLVLAVLMLAIITSVLRFSATTARHQRHVYATLLASAKKASLLPVSVVVPLRRRADSLELLFAELAAQNYPRLEVIVVIYHTAGSRAQAEVRRLARNKHLAVKTVRHIKGRQLDELAAGRASGEVLLHMTDDERLTPRFFEYASFAFTQEAAALRVRRFADLDRRLSSAFRAQTLLLKEVIAHAWQRPRQMDGLPLGAMVRRRIVQARQPYVTHALLFDEFAIGSPLGASAQPSYRSLTVLAAVAGLIALLLLATPFDLLAYVTVLTAGTLFIVASVFILQHNGYRANEKTALIALLPFTPFYHGVRLTVSSLRVALRQARSVRQAPRARTR